MGTTFFPGIERKTDIIKQIRSEISPDAVIATAVVGSNFWAALKTTTNESYVFLFRLVRDGKDWGYKVIDETMHPFYYNCPISLLNKTTSEAKEKLPWRVEMRRLYGEKKVKKTPIKTGDLVTVRGAKGIFKVGERYGKRSFIIFEMKGPGRYRCGTNRLIPLEK